MSGYVILDLLKYVSNEGIFNKDGAAIELYKRVDEIYKTGKQILVLGADTGFGRSTFAVDVFHDVSEQNVQYYQICHSTASAEPSSSTATTTSTVYTVTATGRLTQAIGT